MSSYKTDWHLLKPNQQRPGMPWKANVYCMNGSAHIRKVQHRASTTCPECIAIFNTRPAAEKRLR